MQRQNTSPTDHTPQSERLMLNQGNYVYPELDECQPSNLRSGLHDFLHKEETSYTAERASATAWQHRYRTEFNCAYPNE